MECDKNLKTKLRQYDEGKIVKTGQVDTFLRITKLRMETDAINICLEKETIDKLFLGIIIMI